MSDRVFLASLEKQWENCLSAEVRETISHSSSPVRELSYDNSEADGLVCTKPRNLKVLPYGKTKIYFIRFSEWNEEKLP